MSNEAFARVKIDALLAAQGWDVLDANAVRFEVQLPAFKGFEVAGAGGTLFPFLFVTIACGDDGKTL